MNNKKLIKGIIYDDPDILLDSTAAIIGNLNYLVSSDDGINKINQTMSEFTTEVPSREEFLTGTILDCIVHPTPYHHNMIIPADAVSEKLYKDLKKIDIGEYLQDVFIRYTIDYHNELSEDCIEEEQGYEIVQNIPHGNVYRFNSKGDLLDFLKSGLENGNFTEKQYLKMMSDIERLSA